MKHSRAYPSTILDAHTISDLHIEMDENDLIEGIRLHNNMLYFGELYDRHSSRVYNKCLSFVKNRQEAEDLTQDVFLKVYTSLHKFKGNSKFSTWLYAITYNFCVNYVNRDRSRKMAHLSDSYQDKEYAISNSDNFDIEDEKLFSISVVSLELALNKIAPKDKVLLLLKYQDDLSIKELEAIYKIGSSAIKMRLKRAKVKLVDAFNKSHLEIAR